MSRSIVRLGALCLMLCVAGIVSPAFAEQSGTQPQPSPSPTPSPKSPLEQAQDEVKAAADRAAEAYKEYRNTKCSKTAGPTALAEDEDYLNKANERLDKKIEAEAALDPDVKSAAQDLKDATDAEERATANPNTSASDLVSLHKKTSDAAKGLKKAKKKKSDAIRKRLTDGGYVFGVPAPECQKQDVAPSPAPKDKPHPKPKKVIGEDDPRYMEGYKTPASTKPATHKKSGDTGNGPSREDVDRETEQPSNDNDKQPEIPLPH